ncbi:MAG: hypothetical protein HY879_00150 [Deltaproteobacteria bacterium]|nr:hypothetical protein [Deltaproteobacteria bacterium]
MQLLSILLACCLFWLTLPGFSQAQEEVTSNIARYRERELSTGYYEDYEVRPRSYQPYVQIPERRKGLIRLSPKAESVRQRAYLSDSHWGILFYEQRSCTDCHADQAKNIHSVRAKITCRQCHGGEPIASIGQYISPMNPIRRHAYVCAKCHEGAGASFATYVVHAPNPLAAKTSKTFPALFYVFWLMMALAIGTFAFFIPHAFLWGLREFLTKEKKNGKPASKESD